MKIEWGPQFVSGNNRIDAQHKQLIEALGIFALATNPQEKLDFLKEYTIFHFNSEEELMMERNYDHFAAHRREHLIFISMIAELSSQLKVGININEAVETFLGSWIVEHIVAMDVPMVKELSL